MAQRIIVTLSDDEYATLVADAQRQGIPLQTYIQTKLQSTAAPIPQPRPLTEQEFLEKLYRAGKLVHVPSGEPDTPEDEAEIEALAQRIGAQKPWLSDLIIEDRGPR